MTQQRLFLCMCLMILVVGCVPKTRYTWNNYDNKLYQHYKNPANNEQFIEQLKDVIDSGEAAGNVPPGIYAEYGFALYEAGNFPEAAKYFQLESDKWPESRVLMTKMIQNAQMGGKKGKQPTQTAAPASPNPESVLVPEGKGASK